VGSMTTLLRFRWIAVLIVFTPLRAAEFTTSLTPEEFEAAGLSKLTPAERARLDALVRGQKLTEVDRVRVETTAKVKAEVAASPSAAGSLLHRMKVVLTPGTDIAYERVETQLVGTFSGYKPGRVLTLANGQQWRVLEGSWSQGRPTDKVRKVVIEPGALGSFFLNIEGGGRPKVQFVGSAQ
jgi:hypothetical protein